VNALDFMIDQHKLADALEHTDDQTRQLAYEVYSKLRERLELTNAEQEAISRLCMVAGGKLTDVPGLARNNVFKAADRLDIPLPSGIF